MNIASQTQSQPKTNLDQRFSKSIADREIAIGDHPLNINQVVQVARYSAKVLITESEEVLQKVQASCDWVAEAVASGEPIYNNHGYYFSLN